MILQREELFGEINKIIIDFREVSVYNVIRTLLEKAPRNGWKPMEIGLL